METNLNFGQAVEAMKAGRIASREGWNGKGMFVFMRPADELTVGFIIEKIKSLPDSVKGWYADQTDLPDGLLDEDKVKFTAAFMMKAADGSMVNGWLASQTDMIAEDWCILDY